LKRAQKLKMVLALSIMRIRNSIDKGKDPRIPWKWGVGKGKVFPHLKRRQTQGQARDEKKPLCPFWEPEPSEQKD